MKPQGLSRFAAEPASDAVVSARNMSRYGCIDLWLQGRVEIQQRSKAREARDGRSVNREIRVEPADHQWLAERCGIEPN